MVAFLVHLRRHRPWIRSGSFPWAFWLAGAGPSILVRGAFAMMDVAILLPSIGNPHPRIRFKKSPAAGILVVTLGQGVLGFGAGTAAAVPGGLLRPSVSLALGGVCVVNTGPVGGERAAAPGPTAAGVQDTRAAAAPGPPVCEARDLGGRLVHATGRVEVPVPPAQAYAVVSDFDRLAEFVTAMDSSRVLARDSLGVRVRQVGMAALIVPHAIRMTLRFVEFPPSRLRFEIVSGDFPLYYGVWQFEPLNGGTLLLYSVTMRPPTFIPVWLVRPSIEKVLCRTLAEVRQEATRREAERWKSRDGEADPAGPTSDHPTTGRPTLDRPGQSKRGP